MTKVSVIGLGNMGAVLAHTLLQHDYTVTVWNRSADKAQPLVEKGALLAPTIAAAVQASPIVIICVFDYNATYQIFASEEVTAALKDRIVVQLSTGTPQEAREGAVWAKERGIKYLDGAIMATPSQIGRPDTPIFAAGSAEVFATCEPVLKTLAGKLQYMGENAGTASAWDMGVLSYLWGALMGFYHGALIFQSEGIPVNALGSVLADFSPIMGEMIKHDGELIQSETYDQPQNTIDIAAASLELFVKQAVEAKINSEIPTFMMGLYRKAQLAGYGNESIPALVKLLRTSA
jgi:3-hydroxyisobutyrate dehydrogenase-like beta-hydroxyacid dehydrogenase